MMHVAGYFLSVLIGFSLGLVGGGGAILAIPVLVFFFGIDPEAATTYSLFIVGLTAISGSINHYRIRNIDFPAAILFGIPSVIMLFVMRRWLVKQIPSTIFQQGTLVISKSLFIMIVFSIVMLIAGLIMIKKKSYSPSKESRNLSRLVTVGCITGTITGFIGIGGGFIIVPALVLFAGLPMKRAIGTSLTIIAVNCLVGILGNIDDAASLDYFFLSTFSALAIIGILLGTWLIRFIPDKNLKPILGWIILAMSIVVFIRIFVQY